MELIRNLLSAIYQRGRIFPLATDLLAWFGSFVSVVLYLELTSTDQLSLGLIVASCSCAALQTVIGSSLGVYRKRFRIASFREASTTAFACALASASVLAVLAISRMWDWNEPRLASVVAICATAGTGIGASRIIWRRLWEKTERERASRDTKVLIIGASPLSHRIIHDIHYDTTSRLRPIGILSDEPQMKNRDIEGVAVVGTTSDLEFIANATEAAALIVGGDTTNAQRQDLLIRCELIGLPAITTTGAAVSSSADDIAISLPTPAIDRNRTAPRRPATQRTARTAHVNRQRPERISFPTPLLVLGDLTAFNAGLLLAIAIRLGGSIPETNLKSFTTIGPILSLVAVSLLYAFDLYEKRWLPTRQALERMIRPILLTAIFGLASAFWARAFAFPRSIVLIGFPLAGLLLMAWRALAYSIENTMRGRERVLLVVNRDALDSPDQKQSIRRLASASASHVDLAGIIDYRNHDAILEDSYSVNLVMLTAAVPSEERSALTADLSACGASVFLIPSPLDVTVAAAGQSYFHNIQGFLITDGEVPKLTAFFKRVTDVLVSAIGLVVLAPVALVIAAAIRLDSPGKVIYSQVRVGRHQKLFTIYKFRSMRNDAEATSGAVLASSGDARITRVGKFLRKTRLDEIPQLINVLFDDMSLIGPRPERPEFVSTYNESVEAYSRRFRVRPGVTGLAQVQAGYSASVEEKIRYDLMYINNLSPLFDLRIAIRTLVTLLDVSAAEGTVEDEELSSTLLEMINLREPEQIIDLRSAQPSEPVLTKTTSKVK